MAVSGGTRSWSRPALESGSMPAWKLEVLERKRAKIASSTPAARSKERDSSPGRRRLAESGERLVLQDSLGPLHDNPFIKLEKERRRRRPLSPTRGPSPLRHLLDMYSNVPGIRTIRAENIIIIESDPGYFGGSRTTHAEDGVRPHRDPTEELLAKRGSKVTEIRASEVVIYEPDPSMKATETPLEPEACTVLEEAGRVSRLLEKFDHGHGKPLRTRSWENLLDRDSHHGKTPMLPKPMERHSHVSLSKAPKRSGEVSPSSASLMDEDSKRFPLNNPAWLPSKPPAAHSFPDPGLFHKRPSSPMTPPATGAPLAAAFPVVVPLSPHYETSTDDKPISPVVASVIERFEVNAAHNNLPKMGNVSQKTGKNTIVVNPKASRNHIKTDGGGGLAKELPPLLNGHVDHQSKVNEKTEGAIKIQDLLSKSKRSRESSGQRLPSSPIKEANSTVSDTRRPKCEVDSARLKSPRESSATPSDPFPHNHCDHSSATPSQLRRVSASTSSNDSFEIRPAPKPDLKNIPENDIQAKALANIRMQSKNSFVFVPKKRQATSEPKQPPSNKPNVKNSASVRNGPKLDYTDSPQENGLPTGCDNVDMSKNTGKIEQTVSSVTQRASSVPALSDFDWKSGLLPSHSSTEGLSFTDKGAELEYLSSVHKDGEQDALPVPVTKIHEDHLKPDIPVTNIDDIVHGGDKEAKPDLKGADPSVPAYRPHTSLSSARNKGGKTFTVVPKRKPVTEQEAFRTPVIDEEDDEDSRSKRKSSDGSEAPYSDLGALLKKRYPTVDEIQVIGGYLSLSKSCLSKNGSTRKKMKISFNEQNIHTMFEYPSEASLGEEDGNESDSEDEEKPSNHLIPRPTFGSSGPPNNSLRANPANSGLSSYIPKHSMGYSKWPEENPPKGESASRDHSAPQEDMLTPADGDSHSDFRSEPALYF
ncbi:taperin [Pelodytes ibericus]